MIQRSKTGDRSHRSFPNHDGLSDPEELLSLGEDGIESIELDYREARKKDRFGNEFRYRARAYYTDGSHAWSHDVILLRRN